MIQLIVYYAIYSMLPIVLAGFRYYRKSQKMLQYSVMFLMLKWNGALKAILTMPNFRPEIMYPSQF